jgi:uncharacterized protein (DUF302 family)
MSEDGLVSVRSALSAWDTIARIEAELAAKGVTIFAKIDHAAGAAAAGDIASDHLDHFWQCKGVAPLMQACQRAGIDLPLKALVWEDGDGTAWLTYNDPAWLARRHALGPSIEPVISAMSAMLAVLTRHATGAGPG